MKETHTFDESDRKGRETGVSRRWFVRSGATGLAALVGLAGVSTPVAAEQGAIFDFFESGDGGRFTKSMSALRGGVSRVFADSDRRTAKESASETTDVFNQNAETIAAYANDQLDGDREKTRFDTIRVVFEKDTTVERWIVADVDDSNTITSVSMTGEEPDRDVDHWVRLKALAATDAPDELDRFVDEYAAEGRSIDSELEGRLAGRYGPDVESSLI